MRQPAETLSARRRPKSGFQLEDFWVDFCVAVVDFWVAFWVEVDFCVAFWASVVTFWVDFWVAVVDFCSAVLVVVAVSVTVETRLGQA
jgi:hypothetical protein